MPLPLLFIGVAAATGATGAGTTIKGFIDQNSAKKLNQNSEARTAQAGERLETLRHQCGAALENLGKEKLRVLEESIHPFVHSFRQIKNVNFKDSIGLEELHKLHIDEYEIKEMEEMASYASSLMKGATTGTIGGALTALGAYNAAGMFAAASTGTAISSLSGAAATNATLAFFGGGSLASGGLGMAGGTAVLGGLVAGPALLVLGMITSAKAGKNLENAIVNATEADVACEQLINGAVQCVAIRRRTNMYYSLLARLDSMFYPMVLKMQDIIRTEGTDFRAYSPISRKIVGEAASLSKSIKAVLDTPLLTENGELTLDSEARMTFLLGSIDK
ncbi:MAG: hypothetical protein MJ092_07915 [Lachnospiraceae bacterium]|nr:hypothetical protein [Lachnospiraceae bacterium]